MSHFFQHNPSEHGEQWGPAVSSVHHHRAASNIFASSCNLTEISAHRFSFYTISFSVWRITFLPNNQNLPTRLQLLVTKRLPSKTHETEKHLQTWSRSKIHSWKCFLPKVMHVFERTSWIIPSLKWFLWINMQHDVSCSLVYTHTHTHSLHRRELFTGVDEKRLQAATDLALSS